MIRGLWTVLFIIILSFGVKAQPFEKLQIGVSTGIASGWWVYTLGTGAGIDRTDTQPKITLEGEVLFKLKRFGLGAGLGYSLLMTNTMDAFEDTRAQRSKYRIADNHVQLLQYYLQMEYALFSGLKYKLSPQVRIGGFSIDTTHPQKENFDNKMLFELSAVNEISLSERLWFTIRPFYQAMMIPVKEELLPGEQHRIFSLGLSFGIRYGI